MDLRTPTPTDGRLLHVVVKASVAPSFCSLSFVFFCFFDFHFPQYLSEIRLIC